MTSKKIKQKKIVSDLLAYLEERDAMNDEDYLDAFVYLIVILSINSKVKDPDYLIDKMMQTWVKVHAVLVKSFMHHQRGEA